MCKMEVSKLFCSISLVVFSVPLVISEIENWEEYPVILTMEYDKAIYLTPDTGCRIVEDR